MHDIAISEGIIKEAGKHGDVTGITCEVGDLAGVLPDELKNTLAQLTGWDVKVLKKKAKVKCSCGFEGAPQITAREHDVVLYECPKCQDIPDILEGSEVIIKEVTLR